jgi:8-oxo-dGTP pyrophosphatase MutT (NUDIX family)
MAVPAHDERDFEFANKYNLPIRKVVEPIFHSSDSPIDPNLPIIKRNAICAVIRNPKDSKYLCSVWRDIHMNGMITGGIEEGEDLVEGAMREIYEESGYKNLKLVNNPGVAIHSLFFHRKKKENRHARFQYLFFDLIDEEQDPIDEKEAAIHDVVWKSRDELNNFFSVVEGEFTLGLIDNKGIYMYSGEGILANSGGFNGLKSEEARVKITEAVGGKIVKTYRLRDWGISRQRYWGTPIPIVYDIEGKAHPVPEEHLPWILPTDVDHTPDGTSPLARSKELFERTEKIFGKGWKPEVETMDTFVDSSWYFYRYLDSKNDKVFADGKVSMLGCLWTYIWVGQSIQLCTSCIHASGSKLCMT